MRGGIGCGRSEVPVGKAGRAQVGGEAEAAGYLGEEGRAMDLAQRAFSQGFTCSAWYRASPFLGKVQPLPRWRAILQHVDERRARLAYGRSPGDFGL